MVEQTISEPLPAAATPAWHSLETPEVIRQQAVDPTHGLELKDVAERLDRHGFNELAEGKPRTILDMVVDQFRDVVVWVLLVATGVSVAMGEGADAVVIILIVILNAVLGVIQERKAERSLAALKQLAAPTARVVRAGVTSDIPARELVPGDLVLLEAGNFVPADARLLATSHLRVEEAALTGESVPVDKSSGILLAEDVPLGDRLNMVYAGTAVANGRARAVVIATGAQTQLGEIARMLHDIQDEPTPLQRRLEGLGRWLALVTLFICAAVFLAGGIRGVPLPEMFLTAVSLAVAAIPEGLPAVVTIVLALGMQNMVQRHAIIRRLRAVEALGAVTVICTDKTGTLTQNEMTVRRFWTASCTASVTGVGYSPRGEFTHQGETIDPADLPDLQCLLQIAALCNDARLEEKDHHWRLMGDPTEGALLAVAAKGGVLREEAEKSMPRLLEIPFDADRKRMSTIHELSGGFRIMSKGAPDLLLDFCSSIRDSGETRPLTDQDRHHIHANTHSFAGQALRVLGFAYRDTPNLPHDVSPDVVERDLVFVGLAGLIDPPRSEVKSAVLIAKGAGIRPVMITGDYSETALAIAEELEIADSGADVIDARRLHTMSDPDLVESCKTATVFARVSPADKLRIVTAFQTGGEIAAMTGDGLNDAPALKRADIGVAMGITGTDVAKDAADVVLTDDNFASIVAAVEEGRGIFNNIRKFVYYLLSCNISEVLTIFLTILAGLPRPLLPVQILWVNLVTDGLPALALGVDPKEPGLMQRPPRNPSEGVIGPGTLKNILFYGTLITVATLAAYAYGLYWHALVPAGHSSFEEAWRMAFDAEFWRQKSTQHGLTEARTYAFTTLAFCQLAHSINCRSDRHSIFQLGLFTNHRLLAAIAVSFAAQLAVVYIPAANRIFDTAPIDAEAIVVVALLSLSPILFGELRKFILRRSEARFAAVSR